MPPEFEKKSISKPSKKHRKRKNPLPFLNGNTITNKTYRKGLMYPNRRMLSKITT